MNIWIIVALYWIVCCVLVYVLAHINGQVAYRRMMKQKTTFWEHLLIVLFSPLAAPIMLFATAYHGCINLYWRKRSIPTHSGWLYPLTFDAGKGLKEA